MSTSPILDSNGRNVTFDDFFQSGSRAFQTSQPSRLYDSGYDQIQLTPDASWMQLLSAGRFLFANSPVIRGALLEQAKFSFPVEARYRGKDKKWGEKAEVALWDWKQNPTFRGETYDYCAVSRVRMIGYKTDGDIFNALTADEDGYPKLQLVRAHRVANGRKPIKDNVLDEGPWRGKRMFNGVVVDDFGRAIGYKLITFKDRFQEGEPRWLPADSFFPTYRPDYSDEMRGISHLSASIRSFADLKRLHDYELTAMKGQSSLVVAHRNEQGAPDDTAIRLKVDMMRRSGATSEQIQEYITNSTGNELTLEEYGEGTTVYLKAGTGSGLDMLRPDRPGESWQSFFDRVTRMALYGIEWDPDFALAIKDPGGAWARTILEKINRSCRHNFETDVRATKRIDFYVLNKLIERGTLSMPSDGDVTSWDYAMGSPRITADIGNEQQAKREAYKMGLLNLHDIAVEDGRDWEDKREQREFETRDLLTRAQRLQSEFPKLSFQEALAILEQRNPNPPAAPSQINDAGDSGKNGQDSEATKQQPAQQEININQAPTEVKIDLHERELKSRKIRFVHGPDGKVIGAEVSENNQ